jgi:BioD-like phosphotransacetylase family protein
MAVAVGLIGAIVIIGLIVAAYSPIFGSLHQDATTANITNSTHNLTYQQGTAVAQGFMGLDMTIVYLLFIVLFIVVILLIFTL